MGSGQVTRRVLRAVAGSCALLMACASPVWASGTRTDFGSNPYWTVYVTNIQGVTPFDTNPVSAIGLGQGIPAYEAMGIAVTPDLKTAYMTSYDDGSGTRGTVTPIDTATNTEGTPIPVGFGAYGVAITPDGKTAYVTHACCNTVTPIDTATKTAGRPITAGAQTTGIAITPDGRTAFVTNFASGTVTPIDTATNAAGAAITAGAHPVSIAITPDGRTAYVASKDGTVTPIDTATNAARAAITIGGAPESVAITPDGKTAYVAAAGFNSGPSRVTPIDTATNTAGTAITVDPNTSGIAITPDGKTAYVTAVGANSNGGTLTPIDTATNTAGPSRPAGTFPTAIAISCGPSHIVLTPASQIRRPGQSARIDGVVKNGCGDPLVGADVAFDVRSGPNAQTETIATTDSQGLAQTSYTGSRVGTDSLVGLYNLPGGPVYSNAGTVSSDNRASVLWTPVVLTGRATAAQYELPGAGRQYLADTGEVSTPKTTDTPTSLLSLPGPPVSASLLNADVKTTGGARPESKSTASTKDLTIDLGGGNTIHADTLRSESTSLCSGSTGTADIQGLTVNGSPVSSAAPPNTTFHSGPLVINVNEQIRNATADGRVLTVNAVHASLPGVADVVLSSARSDIHYC